MSETTETTPADDKPEGELSNAELIARRSADIKGEAATNGEHIKVFVLPPGPKPTEANGYDHRANMAATRQYAISQGLRPTGDVRHVSTEPFGPGRKSWALKYAVPVTPAERVDDWVDYLEGEQPKVITDNELDESGTHVPNATGSAPADSNADTGDAVPTKSANRATIDAYAKAHGVDTSAAKTKAEALALINKPTA